MAPEFAENQRPANLNFSLLLVYLFIPSFASAQYRFHSWTTDNGLPQNSVQSILQTRDWATSGSLLWTGWSDSMAYGSPCSIGATLKGSAAIASRVFSRMKPAPCGSARKTAASSNVKGEYSLI